MNTLSDKHILLGVTGGIAAYKSADLVRRLREQRAEVRVVMSAAACEFITPLTMQALSGNPVHTGLLDHHSEAAMSHIQLARWADLVLVAPATANFIARLAHGLADDLLSTLCLAADVPLLVAPAMNQQMWRNQATQHNIEILAQRDIRLVGPATGEQACGETGPGRMLEPLELVNAAASVFHSGQLSGIHVLVSAGPTREPVDPVRFISNRSSGRMGYALARAALEAGAEVTLVSGPVALQAPERARCITVTTAEQMYSAVLSCIRGVDIFISAAAVADYRCLETAQQKIKKDEDSMVLNLVKNPDILAEVAGLPQAPFTVGFAAETESLQEHALAKLQAKGLDMIAANQVGDGRGFDVDENSLEVFWQEGRQVLACASKDKIARQLLDIIAKQYQDKNKKNSTLNVKRLK
jgi:phosphopantothenoylcysteine decarboxylase/phosphopantothenate--cysteine ligase